MLLCMFTFILVFVYKCAQDFMNTFKKKKICVVQNLPSSSVLLSLLIFNEDICVLARLTQGKENLKQKSKSTHKWIKKADYKMN